MKDDEPEMDVVEKTITRGFPYYLLFGVISVLLIIVFIVIAILDTGPIGPQVKINGNPVNYSKTGTFTFGHFNTGINQTVRIDIFVKHGDTGAGFICPTLYNASVPTKTEIVAKTCFDSVYGIPGSDNTTLTPEQQRNASMTIIQKGFGAGNYVAKFWDLTMYNSTDATIRNKSEVNIWINVT